MISSFRTGDFQNTGQALSAHWYIHSSFGKGKYCIRVGQNTYQLKNKLFSCRFAVVPIRSAAFFYSTKFCLILPFFTNDYINLREGVSGRKQVRLFCNDLKNVFLFYRERGPPLRSELSKNFRSEERIWRATTQKEERTNIILIVYLNQMENIT